MRKTSLLRDRSDGPAVRQADMNYGRGDASCDVPCARVWSSAPTRDFRLARTLGAISSSRCQISRGGEEPDRPFDGRETDKLPGRTQTRWWSQTGSNRRPPACKAGALPTELWPLRQKARRRKPKLERSTPQRWLRARVRFDVSVFCFEVFPVSDWWAWEDLNFRPHAYQARALTS